MTFQRGTSFPPLELQVFDLPLRIRYSGLPPRVAVGVMMGFLVFNVRVIYKFLPQFDTPMQTGNSCLQNKKADWLSAQC